MLLRSFARARIRPRIIRQMWDGLLPTARAKSAWLMPCLTSSTFRPISFTVASQETMLHTPEMLRSASTNKTQRARNICADGAMLPTNDWQILSGFFWWLLDPASFGKTIRNRKLEALRKAIKLLRSVQEGDFRLNEPVRMLEEVMKSYDHTIRRSPTAQIVYPMKSGNVEEKSRLYVAACVAAFLWPTRTRWTAIVEQLESRGDNRESKAVQMQVRRFEKTLGLQPRKVVEWHYVHFKMFTNQALIYRAAKDNDSWAKHATELSRRLALSEHESLLLQRVIESGSRSATR
jgi:hypothetical protein